LIPRLIRLPAALCALIVCSGLAFAASAGASTSQFTRAAATCGLNPKLDVSASLGGGYYTGLSVKGTSCAGGRKVEAAVQACRLKHGVTGRCTTKVLGFTCKETRNKADLVSVNGTLLHYTAAVSCKATGKTVAYSYQQNT